MAQPPGVHSKNAQTGNGMRPQTPGNAGMGNSMHNPATGVVYQVEQQQQTDNK